MIQDILRLELFADIRVPSLVLASRIVLGRDSVCRPSVERRIVGFQYFQENP